MNHPRRKLKWARRSGWALLLAAQGQACAGRQSSPSVAAVEASPDEPPAAVPPRARAREHEAASALHFMCPDFRQPERVGSVVSPLVSEISGLIASRAHPDVLWVHNDSGDGPHLYALSRTGTLLSRHVLPETTSAVDWEDMARLPRESQPDILFVADTGDNRLRRGGGVTIHRFPEPSRVGSADVPIESIPVDPVETMQVTYPDGPRDVEALLVDPWTEQLVLFSKSLLGWAEVFTTPGFAPRAVMERESILAPETTGDAIQLVTGADISIDGHWIALRTYDSVYLFHRMKQQTVSEALKGRACRLPDPQEYQGEAIAFDFRASSISSPPLLTISERVPSKISRIAPR